MNENLVWSKTLSKRIKADVKFPSNKLKDLMALRFKQFGLLNGIDDIHDGNHLRINAFWLFVGAGNSASELWHSLPRKDITLGQPHIFEKIQYNDVRIKKAIYHQSILKILEPAVSLGYVGPKIPGCLSYQYVGNLNISDIIASSVNEEVNGKTQLEDIMDIEKQKAIMKLLKVCRPAFVIAAPKEFNIIKKYFSLKLRETVQFNGNLRGEIHISDDIEMNTVFIRLPHHVSYCGHWEGVKELIIKSIFTASDVGWEGIELRKFI